MNPGEDISQRLEAARLRAARARERAERAEAMAEQEEILAEVTGQGLYARLAATHRQMAVCHRTSERLQEAYALRVMWWAEGRGATQPLFMTGVAEACGTSSAAVTLVGRDQVQLAVAASDEPSRAAQELEFVLSEGPVRDATSDGATVFAAGPAVGERWPRYGPGLADLGLAAVIAVPLRTANSCVGALAVYDPQPGLMDSDAFTGIADALTRTVLLDPDADPELYGGTDHWDVVHQAVGMLSVQASCSVDDALALIKAWTFSRGESIGTIAQQVLRGQLRLA